MLESNTLDGLATATPSVPPRTNAAPSASSVYEIEIISDFDGARERLKAAFQSGDATPFQNPGWLSAWYASVGSEEDTEPLLVFVSERDTGRDVVTLPLIRYRSGGLRIISFADRGVTDYNTPILGPAAPVTSEAARALWKTILKALPAADLIQLWKMPATVRGRPNPLALLRGVHPSHSPGFSVAMPEDWDAYLRSLAKKFRKELGRSLRLFEKESNAAFCRIETADEALRVLEVMNEQQRARLEEMGYRYVLEEDSYHAFYARLIAEGIDDGTVVLTALVADGAVVAALLGINDGSSFAMIRLSHAGGDWMKIGPGRLIIERTMHMLHGQGCRHFDFSIGDYPYKSGFGVTPSPLFNLVGARSWRGQRSAVAEQAKAAVKRGLEGIGVSFVPRAVRDRYRRYRNAD